jgi:hypothetical protein
MHPAKKMPPFAQSKHTFVVFAREGLVPFCFSWPLRNFLVENECEVPRERLSPIKGANSGFL